MVLQIAVRDIGQLTDLESWPVISIRALLSRLG
jgi:hypothetical protein